MTFLYYLFLFLFVIASLLMCVVILMQESKSSGLGASFGSDSGDSLFGASTPEVLKKMTAYLAVVFLGGCILLSFWTKSLAKQEQKGVETEMVES